MKKRNVLLSVVLAGALFAGYHLTHPECAEAQQGGCCGLSTAAAQSLKAMFSSGSFVAPNPLVTTGGTGSGLWEFSGQTNISGPDATTNVEIGSTANDANAGTGGTSVVIGNGATNTINGTGVVAIGSLAAVTTTSGIDSIAIGRAATVNSANGIAIGAGATAANQATSLGAGAQAAANSIALGISTIAAANELVAGSTVAISNLYFGKGKTSATATGWTANGTGGLGADNAGADAFVAGGKGTGSALGGRAGFLRPLRAGTSSTLQNLAPAVIVCPTITLSNTSATAQTIATITTTTTTAGAVTIDYATTASNGTVLDADSGLVKVAWNNNAGTVAAAMTAVTLQSDSDASGTLAATPTVTVATNVVSIKLTPTWVTIVPTTVTGYATFTVHSSGDTVVCQ
jgi:hypothetical protein